MQPFHTLLTTLLLCLLLPHAAVQVKNPLPCREGWTAEELAAARTADTASYLSDSEKAVYFYCNLARMDGQRFAETYARPFLQKDTNPYVVSLLQDLATVKGLPLLVPDPVLCQTARSHATDMGQTGQIGHNSTSGDTFVTRVRRVYKGNLIGENCAYRNSTDALDLVMQLLIDEGIESLGHRKNILKPEFTVMGVSIQPHRRYGQNLVQDFGDRLTQATAVVNKE